LRGINSSRIPSVYNEPGLRPGLISAGLDALRVLRPLGWEAVAQLEKTYLQPLYKPFLEEDAAKYLDEQERQSVQVAEQVFQANPVPAYESWFAQYHSTTQGKWGALEDDNKLDFVQMFLPRGSQ
jgi:hypothetical protein